MGYTHVVPPRDPVQCNRVDVLVEDEGEGDGKVEHGEALCTDVVWQNLNSVGDDEGREGDARGKWRQKGSG